MKKDNDSSLSGLVRLLSEKRKADNDKQAQPRSSMGRRFDEIDAKHGGKATWKGFAEKLSVPIPELETEGLKKFTFAYRGTVVLYVPDFRGKTLGEFLLPSLAAVGRGLLEGKEPNHCESFEKKMRQILDENPRADLRDFEEAIGIKVLKVSRADDDDGHRPRRITV